MDKTAKQNSEAVTTEGGTAAGIFPGGVLPQAVLHRRWFLPEASNTPPEAECAESPAELLALKIKNKKSPKDTSPRGFNCFRALPSSVRLGAQRGTRLEVDAAKVDRLKGVARSIR